MGSERRFRSATSSDEAAVAFEWNGRRFQFCIRRFQSIRRLFLRLCHSPGSPAGVAHGQPRAVPDLVGSGLASPYHFRARIQSFQTVAAPFPGDSVLPSGPLVAAVPATETPRFKRSTIGSAVSRDGGTGTNIERLRNSGKKFVERVGSCA